MISQLALKSITRRYSSFDQYIAFNEFGKLSQEDMILVYSHFLKLGKLDSHEERARIFHDQRRSLDGEPIEDRQILQSDSSRACLNWEIDEHGFQLVV